MPVPRSTVPLAKRSVVNPENDAQRLKERLDFARRYVEEWQKQPGWAFHEGLMKNLGILRGILEGDYEATDDDE